MHHQNIPPHFRQPVRDSTYTGGLVLQAFLGAVRRYLQYYNAQVLLSQARLDETGVKGQGKRKEVTILRVKAIFSRLLEQLRLVDDSYLICFIWLLRKQATYSKC